MRNILISDFFKLKRSKAFWICAALCVVLGIMMVTAFEANMQWDMRQNPADHDYIQAVEMSKHTSAVWGMEQFLPMGFSVLLVGVFIAIFVTSEFTYGTIKNTLSRGADRAKVFFSKFIVCGVAAVFMQLLFVAALLITGTVVWGFDSQGISGLNDVFRVILSQVLVIVSFTALFTWLSTMLRSNGASIAANILCATVISNVINALGLLFNRSIKLNDYWLGGVVSKLAAIKPPSGDVAHGIIVVAAWGVASLIIGTLLFKKADVK